MGYIGLWSGCYRNQPSKCYPADWKVHRYTAVLWFISVPQDCYSNVLHSRIHITSDRNDTNHHTFVHCMGTRNSGAALILEG